MFLIKQYKIKNVGLSGVACVLCFMGVLALSGCDKKDAPLAAPVSSPDSVSDRAANAVTNYIQEPQNRAREAQDLIMQADQRARDAADQASR